MILVLMKQNRMLLKITCTGEIKKSSWKLKIRQKFKDTVRKPMEIRAKDEGKKT